MFMSVYRFGHTKAGWFYTESHKLQPQVMSPPTPHISATEAHGDNQGDNPATEDHSAVHYIFTIESCNINANTDINAI